MQRAWTMNQYLETANIIKLHNLETIFENKLKLSKNPS